ncbi:hypothetical protein BJX99DRAFT_255517 [Aspergillus californicus]
MSPSLAKEVLAVQAPVNNHDMVGYFMRTVWDDKGAIGAMDHMVIWGKIHRVIYQLNREPFLSQAGDIVSGNTNELVLSLVSACSFTSKWQGRASVPLLNKERNEFEASFFPLIRHFVADMVLPSLYGAAFMDIYANISAEMFEFDANFHLFLMGLPAWIPISGLKESAAARARVKSALTDFHNALVAKRQGKTIDSRWGDLGDVSSVMEDRVHLWEEAVGEHSSKEACASSHAFLLWVTLINANVIVFWLLFHIYQDPSLVAAIRAEASPFVQRREQQGTVKLDWSGIRTKTPLLQSAFLETMRLYT